MGSDLKEIINGLDVIVKKHLFETSTELADRIEKEYNIPKENITYEYVNGTRELTIKLPDVVTSIPIKITVLGEEVVCG